MAGLVPTLVEEYKKLPEHCLLTVKIVNGTFRLGTRQTLQQTA